MIFMRPWHWGVHSSVPELPTYSLNSFRTSLHSLPSVCSQQTSSASAPVPAPTNLESPSLEYGALSELRTKLHETHANLPSHVDEAHVIEDLLAEHEVINTQFTTLQDLIHGLSSHSQRISIHIDMQTTSP